GLLLNHVISDTESWIWRFGSAYEECRKFQPDRSNIQPIQAHSKRNPTNRWRPGFGRHGESDVPHARCACASTEVAHPVPAPRAHAERLRVSPPAWPQPCAQPDRGGHRLTGADLPHGAAGYGSVMGMRASKLARHL